MRLEPTFTGLTQPTDLRFLGNGLALATEQAGTVVLLGNGKPRTILDLRERVGCCGERGLLSLALHPDFARNGVVFLYAADKTGGTTLSRVTLNPKTLEADDPTTSKVLLKIAQPGPTHNGGQLQFGPDAHLYLSTGEGEYRPSWLGMLPYAQEKDNFLGKLLRFEVGETGVLSVPKDNPFVANENAKGPVWALGLRNPWRFSFDGATGDLYLADVGETQFEEVNVAPLGRGGLNYGWPRTEGPMCRQKSCAVFVTPVLTYTHDEGCSVTGGYVYRGEVLAELTGHYLYGDFCDGTLWAAVKKGHAWQTRTLLETPLIISSFAQDRAGEVYVLDYAAGTVYRLVAGS